MFFALFCSLLVALFLPAGGFQHESSEFGIVHVFPADQPEADVQPNCTSDTQIIDKLLNGTGYNKFKIPQSNGIEVAVEFWVQAITSIDEITNDFEVAIEQINISNCVRLQLDLYINEVWWDSALSFDHLSPCKQNLSLNHQVLDKLWTPNSCFINSKIAEIHSSPFKNVFLLLYRNGTVNYRVRAKGPCAMNLANFPFDQQTCNLIYESFNYNNQEVKMRWNPTNGDPIKIEALLKQEPYPAGMWDELHVKFTFKRRLAYYFLQAYMPVYLTIFISWISFSLGSRAIPARTMLGVNALLAIIFQFGNIMRNLPKVSYVKGIDVWMLGGMFFIFLSLLELAVIGHLVKDEGAAKKRPPMLCSNKKRQSIPFQLTESPPHSPKGICNYEKRFMFPVSKCELAWSQRSHFWWPSFSLRNLTPNDIDKFCSIAFPACFALFNIAYYSFYLMRSAARAAEGM
ncbi:hypothetical protein M3Y99_00593800 [Aphelenchoides fujianensis]|nr:hypothetical protein M3Y99_00593800 [Aphelenchoides fujianensis]